MPPVGLRSTTNPKNKEIVPLEGYISEEEPKVASPQSTIETKPEAPKPAPKPRRSAKQNIDLVDRYLSGAELNEEEKELIKKNQPIKQLIKKKKGKDKETLTSAAPLSNPKASEKPEEKPERQEKPKKEEPEWTEFKESLELLKKENDELKKQVVEIGKNPIVSLLKSVANPSQTGAARISLRQRR